MSDLILGSDGHLYGTVSRGGALGRGAVFRLEAGPGSDYEYVQLHSFADADGATPSAALLESDGAFYGTTEAGGDFGMGTVFRIDASGTFTLLHSFSGTDGSAPRAPLAVGSSGEFLGTTSEGGAHGQGTIFSVTSTGVFQKLHDFEGPEGAGPWGGLTPVSGGAAFGTTIAGGEFGSGTIYRLDIDGVSAVHSFNSFLDGGNPVSTLVWDGDDALFGTTTSGGGSGNGVVFSWTISGEVYAVLHALNSSEGGYPQGGLARDSSGALFGTTSSEAAEGFGSLFRLDTDSTFTLLTVFDYPFAAVPFAAPLLLEDGTLVGTATGGGEFGIGAVWAFPQGGPLSVVHSFGFDDGAFPLGGLYQHTDGLIYGTTLLGGNGYGTVFRFPVDGPIEYLHQFQLDGVDGISPFGPLTQGPGGELFGTTYTGGEGPGGTIFKLDSNGVYAQTHSLTSNEGLGLYDGATFGSDGRLYAITAAGPGTALSSPDGVDFDVLHAFTNDEAYGIDWKVTEGPDGNFYGTSNGALDRGTVYRLTPEGDVTVVHRFAFQESAGEAPNASLVTADWGQMYGVNAVRGDGGGGTVFEIDTEGHVRLLHAFSGLDGQVPTSLVAGSGGVFFGTTGEGGAHGAGTLFQIDRYGNLLTLHDFDLGSGGAPSGNVIEASDGNIYGGTTKGGTGGFGQGVLFRYSLPVRVLSITPSSGDALGGTSATVAGYGFGDGVGVTIGGQPTGVLVNTNQEITTTGPALFPGTLGDVRVSNPNGDSAVLLEGWLADFLDVADIDPFHAYIEKLVRHHVAVGLGDGTFGRDLPVSRAQLAVFLLKAARGRIVPPDCTGTYDDVPCPSLFADWIEELGRTEITSGCQQDPPLYCPSDSTTRAQMAVFILKMLHGADHEPPPCTGVFEDVPCPGGFAVDWIEELYASGVTGGCNTVPLLYCPDQPVSRGQMAVLLVRAFELP